MGPDTNARRERAQLSRIEAITKGAVVARPFSSQSEPEGQGRPQLFEGILLYAAAGSLSLSTPSLLYMEELR